MEVNQSMEEDMKNASESSDLRLLDCSKAPNVLALANLSDFQLIELIRTHQDNAPYLIALHHRHVPLVKSLLASKEITPALNRWIWFSAFNTLTNSQKQVTPVANWLGRIVALALINDSKQLQTSQALPIPLSWYLYRSLEMMPISLRITCILSEIRNNTDQEISRFFCLHQMPLSEVEVGQLQDKARHVFVDQIPIAVQRLYFGYSLDVKQGIKLLSMIGIDVQQEIQNFEQWQDTKQSTNQLPIIGIDVQQEVPNFDPPQNTQVPLNQELPNPTLAFPEAPNDMDQPAPEDSLKRAILGAFVISFGIAVLGSLAMRWNLLSPEQPSAPSIAQGESTPATTQNQPSVLATTPQLPVVSEPSTSNSAKPAPKESTVVIAKEAPKKNPVAASTPILTVTPKQANVTSTAVAPKDSAPITAAALPTLDDAPRNHPPHFFIVLVADPLKQNLRNVRRFEPGSYYRTLKGQPWIQVGAYDTFRKSQQEMESFRAKGFTVTIARS
jgi:hypothetical protein